MRISSIVASCIVFVACNSSSETTGQPCKAAGECYAGVDAAALSGAAVCLTKTSEGYCTHECETDADCCAAPGECKTTNPQVCAPFESTGKRLCFLSCEAEAIASAPNGGTTDPDAYCDKFASRTFTCRSTGGGAENRKVCFPPG